MGETSTPTSSSDPPRSSERPRPRALRDNRIGVQLGKYVITGRLGSGGMGIVYEARDTLLHRQVAIKVFRESASLTPDGLQRFLREAQAVARLSHPNVIAIFEIDYKEKVHYMAMELVAAGSAEDLIRTRGTVHWREATRIVAEACRGLAAAHDAGLIHRDIKPANILIAADTPDTLDPAVKLADFGLAKPSDSSAVSMTAADKLMGTPHYMSPEQCRAEKLDVRSDVYALGATYYALLAGKPPFAGDVPLQVMFAHCSNPIPDPRTTISHVPPECSAIIHRAMAKEARDRYPSAQAILADLESVLGLPDEMPEETVDAPDLLDLDQEQPAAPPPPSSLKRHWPIWAGLAAAVLTLLLIRPFLGPSPARHDTPPRDSGTNAETPISKAPFTSQTGSTTAPAQLADAAPSPASPPLAPRRLRMIDTTRFTVPVNGHISSVAISPNGRLIAATAFDEGGGVTVFNWATGLQHRTLWAKTAMNGVAFSPDGAILYAGTFKTSAANAAPNIRRFRMSGQELPPIGPTNPGGVLALAISPTGHYLAVGLDVSGDSTPPTVVLDTADNCREVGVLSQSGKFVRSLAFGNDHILATAGDDTTLHLWNTPPWTSAAEPDTGGPIYALACSADAKLVACAADCIVTIYSTYDTHRRMQFRGMPGMRSLAFTRDSSLLAVGTGDDDRHGEITLYTTSKGLPVLRLTGHGAKVTALAFSEDGKSIVSGGWDRQIKLWDIAQWLPGGIHSTIEKGDPQP